MAEEAALSPKHRMFVEKYLQCWNASRAAREAGYNGRSDQIGYRLLRDVEIQAEISRRLSAEAMSANEVLHRVADHARASPEEFLTVDEDSGGWRIDLSAAKRAGRLHLLRKLKRGPKGDESFELVDPQHALDTLARAHGLLKDRLEVLDFSEWTTDELDTYARTGEIPERFRSRGPRGAGAGEGGAPGPDSAGTADEPAE